MGPLAAGHRGGPSRPLGCCACVLRSRRPSRGRKKACPMGERCCFAGAEPLADGIGPSWSSFCFGGRKGMARVETRLVPSWDQLPGRRRRILDVQGERVIRGTTPSQWTNDYSRFGEGVNRFGSAEKKSSATRSFVAAEENTRGQFGGQAVNERWTNRGERWAPSGLRRRHSERQRRIVTLRMRS